MKKLNFQNRTKPPLKPLYLKLFHKIYWLVDTLLKHSTLQFYFSSKESFTPLRNHVSRTQNIKCLLQLGRLLKKANGNTTSFIFRETINIKLWRQNVAQYIFWPLALFIVLTHSKKLFIRKNEKNKVSRQKNVSYCNQFLAPAKRFIYCRSQC